MSLMSNAESVKEQYADTNNLSVRAKLHQKYSTNPYTFPAWRHDHYRFFEGCRILELGCGSGVDWEKRVDHLPKDAELLLSDVSEGMLRDVRGRFTEYSSVAVQQIDIQNIPFPDSSFDVVIANHMLYHVPDLPKALSEVYRVLKPGGVFYSSTISTRGMHRYLHNAIKAFDPRLDVFSLDGCSFTVENGAEVLEKFFYSIKLFVHTDSLDITVTQDLIDWIESTISMRHLTKDDTAGLYSYFENIRIAQGSITIPKLTGIFVSAK